MKYWRTLPFFLTTLFFLFVTPVNAGDVFLIAQQDLAEKLRIDSSRIELYEWFDVTWSDTSYGCPEEGYVYTQLITPGFKMIFKARKKPYIYHTDVSSHVKLCPKTIIPEWYFYYKKLFKGQIQ